MSMYSRQYVAKVAKESAEDIRLLLSLVALHDECKEETKRFNAAFQENLRDLDAIALQG